MEKISRQFRKMQNHYSPAKKLEILLQTLMLVISAEEDSKPVNSTVCSTPVQDYHQISNSTEGLNYTQTFGQIDSNSGKLYPAESI